MFAASKSGSADAKDANFKNVTMLLHGNGTNGAQNNTFVDSSTNNFTITRNGNTTQGTFSPYGSNWSNYFDGATDYLSVSSAAGNALGSGDFTVQLWFYLTGTTGVGASGEIGLIGCGNTTSSRFTIRCQGSSTRVMSWWLNTPTNNVAGSTAIALNTWYHVALVRSGSSTNNVKLYLNGVLESQGTSTYNSPADNISIGRGYPNLDGEYTNGYISNLQMVVGTALYTGNFTPPIAPLTAVTNTALLTCQSNRFIDNSTNNFTITKNGDVSVQRFSPFNATSAYSTSVIGGSGYFDGSGDYLTAPDNAALTFATGDWTAECWCYPTVAGSASCLFARRATGATYGALNVSQESGGLNLLCGNGSSFLVNVTGTSMTLNAWNHVAAVRNGSTFTLYLNGSSIGTATSSGSLDSTTSVFSIGAFGNGSDIFDGGYISNFRFVKGTALYSGSTYTVPTAPLTAVTNTSLLLNNTNAGILDNAEMNDLETVGNAQISTSVKKYGTGSMYFDGTGDYLKTPSSPNLSFGAGNFTIEMWVYQSGSRVQSYPTLIGNNTTWAANYWDICLDRIDSAGKITVWINNVNSILATITGTTSLSQNTWYHIALVRNGTTLTLYLNGTSDGSASISTTAIDNNGSNFSIIGSQGSGTEFSGYIDDLRITKGVARYTSNFTAPTAPFADKG